MKVIEQSHEIISFPSAVLNNIEAAGRTCYKSENRAKPGYADRFVRGLIKSGHESVIEHESVTVRFITNRGVTHELVRHRLAAYSQESTRYVDYLNNMKFIKPVWCTEDSDEMLQWISACSKSEVYYWELRAMGWRPEQAREVLPNSLKTKIVMTANMREWRHVFKLRCSNKAHPQMRELMRPLCLEFKEKWPALFDDITW